MDQFFAWGMMLRPMFLWYVFHVSLCWQLIKGTQDIWCKICPSCEPFCSLHIACLLGILKQFVSTSFVSFSFLSSNIWKKYVRRSRLDALLMLEIMPSSLQSLNVSYIKYKSLLKDYASHWYHILYNWYCLYICLMDRARWEHPYTGTYTKLMNLSQNQ